MTNTLGYLEFAQQGRKKEALLAAVDLDGPYTIFQHRSAILADEPCPDWANLRIRQAVWRSVPLAVVSLHLAAGSALQRAEGCFKFGGSPLYYSISLSLPAEVFGEQGDA
jgi:hypothetical protein